VARVDVSRAANIVVVAGSSGSGKSEWVKRQIRRKRRVIVWDPDGEYDGQRFASVRELLQVARANPAGPGRYCLTSARLADFDLWAKIAFAWANCVAVAEETADVTSPGKAPEGWGQLVRRGRKRGITVIGVTQRPAESDKTIMGNATLIHCGRLARDKDRRYMAQELDCPLDALPTEPLEWVERRPGGEFKTGKLFFRGQKKPIFTPKK